MLRPQQRHEAKTINGARGVVAGIKAPSSYCFASVFGWHLWCGSFQARECRTERQCDMAFSDGSFVARGMDGHQHAGLCNIMF
jgi:hypothetical protein